MTDRRHTVSMARLTVLSANYHCLHVYTKTKYNYKQNSLSIWLMATNQKQQKS